MKFTKMICAVVLLHLATTKVAANNSVFEAARGDSVEFIDGELLPYMEKVFAILKERNVDLSKYKYLSVTRNSAGLWFQVSRNITIKQLREDFEKGKKTIGPTYVIIQFDSSPEEPKVTIMNCFICD